MIWSSHQSLCWLSLESSSLIFLSTVEECADFYSVSWSCWLAHLGFPTGARAAWPHAWSDFSSRTRTVPCSQFVSHLDSRILLVSVPSLESGSGLNSIKLVLFYRFLFLVGFPVGFWGKHRSSHQAAIPACTVSPAQFLPPGFLLPLVFFVSVTRAHLESSSCSVFISIFQS
jgi:hypothetical protein